MAGTIFAAAETPGGVTAASNPAAGDPVAQARQNKSWEFGPLDVYKRQRPDWSSRPPSTR